MSYFWFQDIISVMHTVMHRNLGYGFLGNVSFEGFIFGFFFFFLSLSHNEILQIALINLVLSLQFFNCTIIKIFSPSGLILFFQSYTTDYREKNLWPTLWRGLPQSKIPFSQERQNKHVPFYWLLLFYGSVRRLTFTSWTELSIFNEDINFKSKLNSVSSHIQL